MLVKKRQNLSSNDVMTMKQGLCFLNEDGEVMTASIFKTLLRTLLPAFADSAEEIYITYSRVIPGQISARYEKGRKVFALAVKANFSPADVFVRLRIIAGMSIVAEGHQTGKVVMRFNGHDFDVHVEVTTKETEEIIHFKCGNQLNHTRNQ